MISRGEAAVASLALSVPAQYVLLLGQQLAESAFVHHQLTCTLSVHGSRTVPCGFFRMASECLQILVFYNFFMFAIPTLAVALAIWLVLLFYIRRSERRSDF